MLKKLITVFFNNDNLVKVYSHPRSGTHFLEAFLTKNFYAKKDLSINEVTWGHWSNRKLNPNGNPYGKLFGSHLFGNLINTPNRKIYIIRDGRSVAYSVWKTDNFIHKDLQEISFKEFLRTKIDWHGTPALESLPKYTIIEHWHMHVNSWLELEKKDNNLLVIYYEDLVSNPYDIYLKIHDKFFSKKKKLYKDQLDTIKKPVGLLPNKAIKDSWKEVFDKDDIDYFLSIVDENLNYN